MIHKQPAMLILALERSSSTPGAALYRDGALLASCEFSDLPNNRPADQPENLQISKSPNPQISWASAVHALFTETATSPAELSAILLAIGPGSFSGIRASIAFAQGLALPHPQIKILGASTMAVCAWKHVQSRARDLPFVWVAGDARRENVWHACYKIENGKLLIHGKPTHTSNDFKLSPYHRALPVEGELISPEAERLRQVGVAAQPCVPTAGDIAGYYFSDPSAFIENPLPIYPHNAV